MKRGGNMDKDPFEEYLKESEPDKASKGLRFEYGSRTSGCGRTETI